MYTYTLYNYVHYSLVYIFIGTKSAQLTETLFSYFNIYSFLNF